MVPSQTYKVLKPQYYDRFSCIGGDCEDNCCYGWSIIIDKKTYNKYRSVKSPVFSDKTSKCIKRIKGAEANDFFYAKFLMTDKGLCPFQAPSGLCEIHRDLGEEYLCRSCRNYPRNRKGMTNEYTELSISMSCPEAVRIALFEETGIDFTVEEMSFKNNDPLMQGGTWPEMGIKQTRYLGYGWDMRDAAITVMQKRECPVAYRLIVIAMMLDEVVNLHDEGKYDDIPDTLRFYGEGIYGDEFLAGFDGISPNEDLQMKMYSSLYLTIVKRMKRERSTVFKQLIEGFEVSCLGGKADMDEPLKALEFYRYINELSRSRWSEFCEKWEYVIENYLVNYMFSELFPLTHHKDGLNPYHHTFLLAEQYAILKILLCGNYDEAEGFTRQLLVRTISQVAELGQHSQDPLKIVQSYRAIGIDTPVHLYYFVT